MNNKKINENKRKLDANKEIYPQVLDRLVWQKALHRAIQKNRDKQVQKNFPN
jgi:hypothetical protein